MNNRIAYPAQNDGGARELDERSYATIRLSKSASPDTNLTKDQTNLPLFHSQNDAGMQVIAHRAFVTFFYDKISISGISVDRLNLIFS